MGKNTISPPTNRSLRLFSKISPSLGRNKLFWLILILILSIPSRSRRLFMKDKGSPSMVKNNYFFLNDLLVIIFTSSPINLLLPSLIIYYLAQSLQQYPMQIWIYVTFLRCLSHNPLHNFMDTKHQGPHFVHLCPR